MTIKRSQHLWAVAIATLALTACAQAPAAEIAVAEAPAPQPQPQPERQIDLANPACKAYPSLFVTPRIARQGATLRLVAQEPVGAYAPREIPDELVHGWSASPAGFVTIAPDGKSMVVSDTARPGAEVTISAKFCDKPLTRTIRIVGKDEPVIIGFWRQESVTCSGATPPEPVRELDITDLGVFGITYLPFESYRDYWGNAAFDAQTGTLVMTTAGGNRVPSDADLSGKASITADGKLVLDGFYLGQPVPQPPSECRYVFKK